MSDNSRSPKHRRLSTSSDAVIIVAPGDPSQSENSDSQHQYTRDSDFWLQDGNLILLAGRSAFCVYRGLLAKTSPIFADMLAAGSMDASETYDGSPVVRLPDHPHDLRDFLQYLMPCSPLKLVAGVPKYNFEQLHAAFHLGHKYQCQDVEVRVLSILKHYYTSSFTEHDGYNASKHTLIHPPLQAAVAAINIARLTDTPSMLPFALYEACMLDGCVLDGYKRRDGSVEHLSAQDLKLCMNARRALGRELDSLVKNTFVQAEYRFGCTQPETCATVEAAICDDLREGVPGECNVLQSNRQSIADSAVDYGLCKFCKKKLLEREGEERRRVWMKLPVIFGFTIQDCGFTDGGEWSQ